MHSNKKKPRMRTTAKERVVSKRIESAQKDADKRAAREATKKGQAG